MPALRRQAYNGLAKRIKNDMVHHHKPNSLKDSAFLHNSSIPVIGNAVRKFPAKTALPDLPETNPNTNPTHAKSDSKSGKGSSHSKQKNNSGSKGSTSDQKKPDPDLSSKLGKDGKLTPQERQRRLDNNLCLFCGTSGHVAKDCPKSSSASSKARASKTEQDKSTSSAWTRKRPEQSSRLRTNEDCVELPRAKTITLNASALSNPDSLTLSLTSDTLPDMILKSLVDSGSSDSFIDSAFVQTQHLPAYGIHYQAPIHQRTPILSSCRH